MSKALKTLFALLGLQICLGQSLWAHRLDSRASDTPKVPLRAWDIFSLSPFFRPDASLWVAMGNGITGELREAHEGFTGALKTNSFHLAILAFQKKLIEADHPPWAAEALWHIAEGYHRMLHFHEASEYWQLTTRALGKGAMMNMAKVLWGESLFNVWRLQEAFEAFRGVWEALEDPAIRSWALFRMGDCSMELGQEAQAKGFYDKALSLDPHPRWIPPQSLENMARDSLARGRGYEAARSLMTLLSLYGDHPKVHLWAVLFSRALILQGKKREALVLLERTANLAKSSRDVNLARLHLTALGNMCSGFPGSPSEATFTELEAPSSPFFNEDPKDRDLQWALGELAHCVSEKYGPMKGWEILANLKRGLSGDSMWPDFKRRLWQVGKGLISESVQMGDFSTAIEVFEELSDLLPGTWQDPSLLMDIAMAKEELGFHDGAAELYGRVRNLAKNQAQMRQAALGLMRSFLRELKTDEAQRLLKEEGTLGKDWKEGLETVLRWAAKANVRVTGDVSARLIRERAKGEVTPETVVSLCRQSLDRGLCPEGISLVEKMVLSSEGDPSWASPRAWTALGDLYFCGGKPREARDWYLRAADSTPWEDASKWAALRLIQEYPEGQMERKAASHLRRLLNEPKGSPWRTLAESIVERMRYQMKAQGRGGKPS